jgi:hypothetical protein
VEICSGGCIQGRGTCRIHRKLDYRHKDDVVAILRLRPASINGLGKFYPQSQRRLVVGNGVLKVV